MGKRLSPEKRVGKTANLLIFLGILYSSISILGFTGCVFFSGRGYGVVSLIIALIVVVMGYTIRYGVIKCLYAATGLFTILTIYFILKFVNSMEFFWGIRLGLSGWALSSIIIVIPDMIKLKANGSMPDRNSKYKDFFLRRKSSKNKDEVE